MIRFIFNLNLLYSWVFLVHILRWNYIRLLMRNMDIISCMITLNNRDFHLSNRWINSSDGPIYCYVKLHCQCPLLKVIVEYLIEQLRLVAFKVSWGLASRKLHLRQ